MLVTLKYKPRVLVVDDSASARAIMLSAVSSILSDSQVEFAVDGRHALQMSSRAALSDSPFTLILLDIEMPLLNGLDALAELIKLQPSPKVIMSSALTRKGASASMQALSNGACDYICKPTSTDKSCLDEFNTELKAKIKYWSSQTLELPSKAASLRKIEQASSPIHAAPRAAPTDQRAPSVLKIKSAAIPKATVSAPAKSNSRHTNERHSLTSHRFRCDALAIGSSTGGPQALLHILKDCMPNDRYPIFITQHMPPTFTNILAEQISKSSRFDCREGRDGETVQPGRIYLAPGTHHMIVEKKSGRTAISLRDSPPVNFCRPAVDPMIESLSDVYQNGLQIIILTGMGQDGAKGASAAKSKGARVAAQDEDTSVVWGMPGAIVKNGTADEVLPLNKIASFIGQL